MKKNIFGGLFCAVVGVSALTSCLGDVGNKFTLTQLMCTVVSVGPTGQVTVQIDALGAYYYADEFNGKDMEKGERYLLEKMTVNNDEQPAGAMGTLNSPVKMTEVGQVLLIDTKDVLPQDDESLNNDSLGYFYAPYINISTMGMYDERTYITFSGGVQKKTDPSFRLVAKGTISDSQGNGKDTLCYEFKAHNTREGEKGNLDSYAQCFRLNNLPSEQIVKIYFYSKQYQANDVTSIKPSYCIVKAPKKSGND